MKSFVRTQSRFDLSRLLQNFRIGLGDPANKTLRVTLSGGVKPSCQNKFRHRHAKPPHYLNVKLNVSTLFMMFCQRLYFQPFTDQDIVRESRFQRHDVSASAVAATKGRPVRPSTAAPAANLLHLCISIEHCTFSDGDAVFFTLSHGSIHLRPQLSSCQALG